MDESALRRKALESMMKKREGKDGAKGESEVAEDGEVLSPSDGDAKPPSGVVKKSKWADDDEGGGSDALSHRPPEAKRTKAADGKVSPSRQPTPTDSPAAAAAPPSSQQKQSRSKWAADDDDEEPTTTSRNLAEAKAPAMAAAAKPPTAASMGGVTKKSRWAVDSDDDEEDGTKARDSALAKQETNNLMQEARGQGDATSALDLLEDRLGKRVASTINLDGEAGVDGEEGGDKGDETIKEEEGLESTEPVEPYDVASEHLQLHRCRDVDKAYQKLNKIDEGTYGVVYRAKCRRTEKIVALKQVKLERAREGFPLTALRELTVLLALRHVNIVHVIEVVVSPKKQVFMAMEYMEHDFRALMESMKSTFRTPQIKCLMKQLLAGVEFMHRHWVIHRDLKTSNLLLDNRGQLKVCDFGLARKYRDPIAAMTPEVVTLWYRAPELLYGEKKYDIKIDMWSVGCIFAELLLHKPLMCGKNEQDQRDKIVELLGSPDEENWPNFSMLPGARHVRYKKKQSVLRDKIPRASYTGENTLSDRAFEMLKGLLSYSPAHRLSALQCLEDGFGYFDEAPKACQPEHMPTWPSTHEAPKGQKKRARSPIEVNAIATDDEARFNL